DIAHDKRAIARVLDNIAFPNQRYADLAVDDDPKTCSSTDFANSSRTEPPWWRIWFPYNVIFSNIEMTINKTTLPCINDTFGPNCSITCNEHCTGLCDSVNGTCSRCELHFKWRTFKKPCENFTYGQNCSERCDEICLGPCNKTGAALNVLLDVRDHIVTNVSLHH
ncbi:hypothetical protein MAR_023819, partial [Mya arenaria]